MSLTTFTRSCPHQANRGTGNSEGRNHHSRHCQGEITGRRSGGRWNRQDARERLGPATGSESKATGYSSESIPEPKSRIANQDYLILREDEIIGILTQNGKAAGKK